MELKVSAWTVWTETRDGFIRLDSDSEAVEAAVQICAKKCANIPGGLSLFMELKDKMKHVQLISSIWSQSHVQQCEEGLDKSKTMKSLSD